MTNSKRSPEITAFPYLGPEGDRDNTLISSVCGIPCSRTLPSEQKVQFDPKERLAFIHICSLHPLAQKTNRSISDLLIEAINDLSHKYSKASVI